MGTTRGTVRLKDHELHIRKDEEFDEKLSNTRITLAAVIPGYAQKNPIAGPIFIHINIPVVLLQAMTRSSPSHVRAVEHQI